MLNPYTKRYVLSALQGTPDVLDALLGGLDNGDARWDSRPDPKRFTLREVVAHLADWEGIFRQRMERMRDEEGPTLPDMDEGQIAVERGYAHSDAPANLARFRAERQKLLAFLHGLPDALYSRPGIREGIGTLTIGDMIVLIAGHDGYHTAQAAQWLGSEGVRSRK